MNITANIVSVIHQGEKSDNENDKYEKNKSKKKTRTNKRKIWANKSKKQEIILHIFLISKLTLEIYQQ